MQRTIVDGETGEVSSVALTDVEAAELTADQAASAELQATDDRRLAFLRSIRPGAAILTKLRDGTALTAAELQIVVRYLAVKEYLREVAP